MVYSVITTKEDCMTFSELKSAVEAATGLSVEHRPRFYDDENILRAQRITVKILDGDKRMTLVVEEHSTFDGTRAKITEGMVDFRGEIVRTVNGSPVADDMTIYDYRYLDMNTFLRSNGWKSNRRYVIMDERNAAALLKKLTGAVVQFRASCRRIEDETTAFRNAVYAFVGNSIDKHHITFNRGVDGFNIDLKDGDRTDQKITFNRFNKDNLVEWVDGNGVVYDAERFRAMAEGIKRVILLNTMRGN